MYQSFSIEAFVREHRRLQLEANMVNANAVISSRNFDHSDYLAFLKPPKDVADIKKYVEEHPAVELGEIISVHEPVECKNLINTGIVDSVEKEYLEDFDFHLMNFTFDIRPKYNFGLNSVAVQAKFNEFFVQGMRPRIISYFPTPEIFRDCQTAKGKIVVTGGKGFQYYPDAEYDEKKHRGAEADFVYDYSATRRSVFASQTGSGFFFKFFVDDKNRDTQTFRIRTIFLRPRHVKKILMNASFIVNEFPVEYNYLTELNVEESKF